MQLYDDRPEGDRAQAWVVQELRRVIGAGQFDYAALARGVHVRAGRIRRRRTLATGASVAVLGPALVGGAALVLPGLLPSGTGVLAASSSWDAATTGTHDEMETEAELAGATAATTAAAVAASATAAPWQDGELLLPAGGLNSSNDDSAWQIPDARPTGVDHLDNLGAPQDGLSYRKIVPISGVMACNTGAPDSTEPLAGQSWAFSDEAGELGSVELQVTGWSDSRAARDALRDDTMTFCVRDTDWHQLDWPQLDWPRLDWQQVDWQQREGDDDFLLYRAGPEADGIAFALVRQGDYLIGVSVDGGAAEPARVAAEIASKTADNLAALDPVHGRD